MKKLKIFMIVVMPALILSCNRVNEIIPISKSIEGAWKVKAFYLKLNSSEYKMSDLAMDELSLTDQIHIFNEDNTLEFSNNDETQYGTYTYNKSKNELTTVIGGDTETYDVDISGNDMELTLKPINNNVIGTPQITEQEQDLFFLTYLMANSVSEDVANKFQEPNTEVSIKFVFEKI